MKDFFKENKGVSWLLFISLLFIFVPISFYVIKFWNHTFSNDPAVWGTFGDYVGGTINTILSLSSLVILAILTNSVNKQSNEENKKINFLLRRLDSYDQLTCYLNEIGQIIMHLDAHTIGYNTDSKSFSEDYNGENLIDFKKRLIEFTVFLEAFQPRFGHLYQYNFNSLEFNNLIKNSHELRVFFALIISKINGKDFDKKLDSAIFDAFSLSFDAVLRNLSKELK